MYEVGLSKSFVAWHVMPDLTGPESELHSHEYRFDVVVATRDLDDQGMVCDLDVLDAALDAVVDVVSGKNLEVISPPGDDAAVTVEVLARWAHAQLAERLAVTGDLSVRAWESPVAFGGYRAEITPP